jgi:hypothetical protein
MEPVRIGTLRIFLEAVSVDLVLNQRTKVVNGSLKTTLSGRDSENPRSA